MGNIKSSGELDWEVKEYMASAKLAGPGLGNRCDYYNSETRELVIDCAYPFKQFVFHNWSLILIFLFLFILLVYLIVSRRKEV